MPGKRKAQQSPLQAVHASFPKFLHCSCSFSTLNSQGNAQPGISFLAAAACLHRHTHQTHNPHSSQTTPDAAATSAVLNSRGIGQPGLGSTSAAAGVGTASLSQRQVAPGVSPPPGTAAPGPINGAQLLQALRATVCEHVCKVFKRNTGLRGSQPTHHHVQPRTFALTQMLCWRASWRLAWQAITHTRGRVSDLIQGRGGRTRQLVCCTLYAALAGTCITHAAGQLLRSLHTITVLFKHIRLC